MAVLLGQEAVHEASKNVRENRKTAPIKLIHSSELQEWETFPRYQDASLITYSDYRRRLWPFRLAHSYVTPLLEARERLNEIDSDELVAYHSELIEVPGSIVPRREAIPLNSAILPGTRFEASDGRVIGNSLHAITRLLGHQVTVRSLAPLREVKHSEIEQLSAKLEAMTEIERRIIEKVDAGESPGPVLFISHRWESEEHPDPTGEQLHRLQGLRNCYIIYDYTSFPQNPRSRREDSEFYGIMGQMTNLIKNVVILDGQDYLTRGWCVYEYLAAAMKGSIVCDEVQDSRFVNLRDWIATKPPMSMSLHDSLEAMRTNDIIDMIFNSINEILSMRDIHGTAGPQGLK